MDKNQFNEFMAYKSYEIFYFIANDYIRRIYLTRNTVIAVYIVRYCYYLLFM